MLGTLMKHEWNYIWKKMLLFILVAAGSTLIGVFSFSGIANVTDANDFAKVFMILLGLLGYYGVLMCVAFGYLILSGVRFYKNVYGDEAYITHTLPVTAKQIHLSKVIVYSICSIVITLALTASIMIVVQTGVSGVTQANGEAISIFDSFKNSGTSGWGMGVIIVLMLITSGFANVTTVFCAVVLGQYWEKHKVVGAIVWYIILTFIISIISSICMIPIVGSKMFDAINSESAAQVTVGISVNNAGAEFMSTAFIVSTIVSLVVGVACYLIADYGLNKKLNLE